METLLERPDGAHALLVLGHGAGAGMRHAFMEALARRLAARGVATLRYEFPYMSRGRRMPDRRPVLLATVREAAARGRAEGLPLFLGGKSMGGRMSSIAMAEDRIDDVEGLVFAGFPLHPAGKPGTERAGHLDVVGVNMLFVQGTRDKLADLELLRPVLPPAATLHVVEGADHSFHVLKRSGRTDDEALDEVAEAIAVFTRPGA
ncbi:MAG: alpha/beta hydrolase family protein [Planctomycetota bacterium]|jgi:predicted alpha/beta-hydrolase family hydrolase